MIRSCSLQYGHSFKLENNGYSVYMNDTFHGHAPYVNGSLNLGRGNTHVHAEVDHGMMCYGTSKETCR